MNLLDWYTIIVFAFFGCILLYAIWFTFRGEKNE